MANPTDRRLARTVGATVLVELEDTQRDASHLELLFKLGMAEFAIRKLLKVVEGGSDGQ